MDTSTLIKPLEDRKRDLERKRVSVIKEIDDELNVVNESILDAVKQLTGIPEKGHVWTVGDIFLTRFWGSSEVCLIRSISKGNVYFIRLESIREKATVKKDYCSAEMEIDVFIKIQKEFIHHSEWYADYKTQHLASAQ